MNHSESSILDLRVRDLLDQLGSSAPAPGGGAAAALAGALGAALVQMTANLTVGRPKFVDVDERARRIADAAGDLRQQLAALADADSTAFDHVSEAYRLPRADDVQKAARSQAIQVALHEAAAVPLQTARLCADVVHLAEDAAPILNPAVISDVLVGAILAHAALESAALNVEINVGSMSDVAGASEFSSGLERARSGIRDAVDRVLKTGRSRFPHASAKS